ncbi:DUF5916 domain-containing protein [Fulvivirgaceae bacterium BMA10]|uniref:DUF5916 domain-containing protein n=1 Tax=Splendidivirga corallicola TaxID=3051826 RepID=A0ABT8KSS6_9BACT|nr:DUF5916 domain-containing protein [Fulvivirgaceae bacterium BMA10]
MNLIPNHIKVLQVFIALLFHSITLSAQNGGSTPQLHIQKAVSDIQLDGELNEEAWKKAEVAKDFHQYFPFDTSYSETKSEIRMTYDDNFLYIATICRDVKKGGYVTNSLRRDFRGLGNDGISIILDPFRDQTNAFFFGLNPFNIQREALISNGGNGRNSFSLSWDNKWYSASKIYDGYWIGEIAIPFKTLRFKEGSKEWGINFYRLDSKQNERSSWVHIPRNFLIFSLAHTGNLLWDKPLKKPGANVAVIPYVTGGISKNHEEGEDSDHMGKIGGDAKIAVGPSLNLDLTVNPDFSQVEVDQQVTNLDRFELFFPERRQFFLENADLFGSFGTNRIRPFFSRRIGIARDTINDVNVENKIIYGARLSGKINENWRIGFMNMQTSKDEDIGLESFNYTVGAVQRKVFRRSNIGVIFVNKQTFKENGSDNFTLNPSNYNRTIGIDYNLASADNTWTGKTFYHRSFTEENAEKEFAHGFDLAYNHRNYSLEWSHQVVGENYDAEVGFIPRLGFNRINPELEFFLYPNSKIINRHGPTLEAEVIWNKENGRTDHEYSLGYSINFQNAARLNFSLENNYTFLTSSFDPTRTDGVELPEFTDYNYTNAQLFYTSDQRKAFYYELEFRAGQFFNGSIFSMSGNLNYRYQPYVVFSLNYSYDNIRLPAPFSDADLLLIGPRIDLTFSRSVFFTTFIQYNNQIDNININSRFQWRFKPVSDLFVVYTDNYFPDSFKVKNRALVVKFTYWLNI